MTVKRVSKGFTLVEILIVVVILGILAAIVIPQFTNASESAKQSSLISQLQTIRSQLELFQVQHNGTYPDLGGGSVADWGVLTGKTLNTETGPGAGTSNNLSVGPYLQQAPANAFQPSTTATTIGAGGAGAGWTYDQATGVITANMPAATAAKLYPNGVPTADITTY
jgi:general secretion pathway protein G